MCVALGCERAIVFRGREIKYGELGGVGVDWDFIHFYDHTDKVSCVPPLLGNTAALCWMELWVCEVKFKIIIRAMLARLLTAGRSRFARGLRFCRLQSTPGPGKWRMKWEKHGSLQKYCPGHLLLHNSGGWSYRWRSSMSILIKGKELYATQHWLLIDSGGTLVGQLRAEYRLGKNI